MKKWILILFVFIGVHQATAQQDTLKQQVDTTQLKEAPPSLQMLIEEVTAQTETEQESEDADIEIDGLLFDQTKTKSGRDFYDFFYNQWQAPPDAKNYSIYIVEKPYRLRTTLIEVKINETTVFQSYLMPRTSYVEQVAQQAVAQTQLYLANYEEIMRQLEGEDQSGTGIF